MDAASLRATRATAGVVAGLMALAMTIAACASAGPTGQPATQSSTIAPSSPPPATFGAPESPAASVTPKPAGHLNWADRELPSFGDQMPIVLAAGAGTPPVYVGLSAAGAVWRSSGGIDWEHAGDLKFPEGDANRVTTLVFDGDRFLAFGAEGSSAGSSISLAAYTPLGGVGWMSVDGSSWTASKLAAGIRVNRVDVVPGGFVGFGGAGEAPVAVSSRDGLAWTPHIVDTSGGFLPTDVIGLEDGGYLAAGVVTVGTCPDETGVRVWSSTDLDSWAPIPGADLGCGVMDRILRGPAGYLGLGHTLTPEISESLAWFSVDGRAWGPSTILGFNVLTGGIAPDGTFLALGEGIWEFTGGRDWAQSVNTGAFGVVAYAAGLAISCATPNDCRSWRIARVIPGG